MHYIVGGQNRRVGKKVNGSVTKKWIYQDQLNPVAELDSADNVVTRFVYGTRANPPKKTGGQVVPDYMLKDGNTYRIVADHLGSVRLIVNINTGIIEQRIDYNEYGIEVTNTNPGGLSDVSTGLIRFGARDMTNICTSIISLL